MSFTRTTQITHSHCGPAVIQMLLHHLGHTATQEKIEKAAGATKSIQKCGTTLLQLSQAVSTLYPDYRLYYKHQTTATDLKKLTVQYSWPVGVEWQGLFFLPDKSGFKDPRDWDDLGHYSIVTKVNTQTNRISIIDPFPDFSHRTRVFSLSRFVDRWWDLNQIKNPKTGKKEPIKDVHTIFIIDQKNSVLAEKFEMKKYV